MLAWIRLVLVVVGMAGWVACSSEEDEGAVAGWQGRHVGTLRFGVDDNSEVIKLLPDGTRAVLVASKTRKVTLLAVAASGLTELRSANLFADDTSESELTHIDFDSLGRFAAVTRTRPVSAGGALVGCEGSLVFVDVSDSDSFGTVLNEVAVGPMPDAVDISPDDRWVVTGDEKDVYDKCTIEGPVPSVTVLELPSSDPRDVRVRARITMVTEADESPREPEQVIFAGDDDTVAVTLQDSHEVMFFRRSVLLAGAVGDGIVEVGSDSLSIVRLPDRADGAEPWPDGISAYVAGDGVTYFVVTGEYNDVIYVLDGVGEVVSSVVVTDRDVPGGFPRVEAADDVRFRPDSVATFAYEGRSYAAVSLKHAGAVGVWDVSDAGDVFVAGMVKVGFAEGGSVTVGSTLGTEGISAHGSGVVVTANEGESSASLVAPLE